MILFFSYCILLAVISLFFQKQFSLVLLLKIEMMIILLCFFIFFSQKVVPVGGFLLSSSFLALAVSAATIGLSVFLTNMRLGGSNQLSGGSTL